MIGLTGGLDLVGKGERRVQGNAHRERLSGWDFHLLKWERLAEKQVEMGWEENQEFGHGFEIFIIRPSAVVI